MRVIDLFCGAGGFSEGFRNAGFNIIWAVDIWQVAAETYKANHPNTNVIVDDVERLSNLPDDEFDKTIPDSEIIIGSPPCVAFSNSNRSGKADKTNGIRLILSYLRIIARKKYKKGSILKYWIMENVPNVAAFIQDTYTASELDCKGAFVLQVKNENSGVYLAENYGVPSRRKRYLCGQFPAPIKPETITPTPLKFILETLKPPQTDLDSFISDPNYPSLSIASKNITDHHYIQEIAEYQWETALRLKKDKGYMGKMSFPEDIEKPARTIMATMTFSARESMIFQMEGFSNRYRSPTIREVASLMSFPIDYVFIGATKGIKYQQVGNAVPPKMGLALAKAIAQMENIAPGNTYLQTNRNPNGHFYNLNFKVFQLRVESPKLPNSRFKYHIPYLIIDTFRVELTNKESDFSKSFFRWTTEIHKSQGQRAKIFTPEIIESILLDGERQVIDRFIKSVPCIHYSCAEFQRIFCMTKEYRIQNGLTGPFELLNKIKNFLDELAQIESVRNVYVKLEEEPYELPKLIFFGYYILQNITKQMGGESWIKD